MNNSIILYILIAINLLIIKSYAEIKEDSIHPYCYNYNKKSYFFVTCSVYDKTKVKILNEKDDINEAVDNSEPNELLIIPYNSKNKPYKIKKALNLKIGVGLLSNKENKFFYIIPSEKFLLDEDVYFSMVKLQGNNKLTGLAIDTRDYNQELISNIKNMYVYTTAIYSNSDKASLISWCSLHGSDYINTLIYFNPKLKTTGINRIEHSWIETSGSLSGISTMYDKLESSQVNSLVLFIANSAMVVSTGTTSSQFKVVALGCDTNTATAIENNYFILKKTNSAIQPRILLYIEANKVSVDRLNPYYNYIRSNYFYSEQKLFRELDYAIRLGADTDDDISAMISSNMITDNINTDIVSPNEFIGSKIFINGNSKSLPLRMAPSWNEFFSNSLLGFSSGVCNAPLYAVNNLTRSEKLNLTGMPSYNYLCGLPLLRKNFSIPEEFHPNHQGNSKCPNKFNNFTYGFLVVSCIETVALIALIVKCLSVTKKRKYEMI
jgi:hypothetical protein